MDNVILTPHVASASARMDPERRRRVGQEIALVLTGRWPRELRQSLGAGKNRPAAVATLLHGNAAQGRSTASSLALIRENDSAQEGIVMSIAAKPKIAVFSGPTATIQNSEPLVTSNKARARYGLPLRTHPDGSPVAASTRSVPNGSRRSVTIYIAAVQRPSPGARCRRTVRAARRLP